MRFFGTGIFVLVFALTGCKPTPQPINYGSDICHYCSMTIVDQVHAAQIVTEKNKAFGFDAVECMMNQLAEEDTDTSDIALYLVNTYHKPGELFDATQAVFLISEEIPSPMGEFLTAFRNMSDAEDATQSPGDAVYTWRELKERFAKP